MAGSKLRDILSRHVLTLLSNECKILKLTFWIKNQLNFFNYFLTHGEEQNLRE